MLKQIVKMNENDIIRLNTEVSLIANVQKDYKIDFSGDGHYEPAHSWKTGLRRWLRGDNRIKCAEKVNQIVVDFTNRWKEPNPTRELKELFKRTSELIAGIERLKSTYMASDEHMSAHTARAVGIFNFCLSLLRELDTDTHKSNSLPAS